MKRAEMYIRTVIHLVLCIIIIILNNIGRLPFIFALIGIVLVAILTNANYDFLKKDVEDAIDGMEEKE